MTPTPVYHCTQQSSCPNEAAPERRSLTYFFLVVKNWSKFFWWSKTGRSHGSTSDLSAYVARAAARAVIRKMQSSASPGRRVSPAASGQETSPERRTERGRALRGLRRSFCVHRTACFTCSDSMYSSLWMWRPSFSSAFVKRTTATLKFLPRGGSRRKPGRLSIEQYPTRV